LATHLLVANNPNIRHEIFEKPVSFLGVGLLLFLLSSRHHETTLCFAGASSNSRCRNYAAPNPHSHTTAVLLHCDLEHGRLHERGKLQYRQALEEVNSGAACALLGRPKLRVP
jgi:hypothetical protein